MNWLFRKSNQPCCALACKTATCPTSITQKLLKALRVEAADITMSTSLIHYGNELSPSIVREGSKAAYMRQLFSQHMYDYSYVVSYSLWIVFFYALACNWLCVDAAVLQHREDTCHSQSSELVCRHSEWSCFRKFAKLHLPRIFKDCGNWSSRVY